MRFTKFAFAAAFGAALATGPLAVAPASAETVLNPHFPSKALISLS